MSGLTNEQNSFSTSAPPLNYLLITTVSLIIRPKNSCAKNNSFTFSYFIVWRNHRLQLRSRVMRRQMKKIQEMDTNPVDIDMAMQSVGQCLLKCIVNTVVDFLNVLTDYLELLFDLSW